MIKRISGIILLILAVAMLYLGLANGMLPPTLTGVGFLAIAVVFIRERS